MYDVFALVMEEFRVRILGIETLCRGNPEPIDEGLNPTAHCVSQPIHIGATYLVGRNIEPRLNEAWHDDEQRLNLGYWTSTDEP